MSTISPLRHPLPGEQVLALSPSSAEEAARTWRRRPNLLPGRSLTAPALETRQQWAAGMGVLRGQAFTAGVVRGLEVELLPAQDVSRPGSARLRISPGQGLAVSGEDVALSQAVELALEDLPMVVGGAIGDSLGRWRDRGLALPGAGVLVLQPVEFERAAIDPEDPCDRCPCGDGEEALEDWRLVDATRLLWFPWPRLFRRDLVLTPGPSYRNQLAWAVFEAEADLDGDGCLPWESFGVPLALIGLEQDLRPSFLDRAAVARRGGLDRDPRLGLRPDGRLVESWRLPGLWQARIEQLAGHLLDLFANSGGSPPSALVNAAIERWPPCGILPRWSVDLDAHRAELFPTGFVMDAVPVPQEDLDLMIRETAGLAPLQASRTERLQMLIPVPQGLYEPRLLITETIDPLFQESLDRFLLDRARSLATRHILESRDAVLCAAITGKAPTVREIGADPTAPEPERLPAWTLPPGGEGRRLGPQAGWISRRFVGEPITVGEGERPFLWLCLDPEQPVRSLALRWSHGPQEILAIWGDPSPPPESSGVWRSLGELPPMGRWFRLEAPADLLPPGWTLEALAIHVDAGTTPGAVALAATGLLQDGEEREWRSSSSALVAHPAVNPEDRLLDAADWAAPFEERFGVVADGDDSASFKSLTLEELMANSSLAVLSPPEKRQIRQRGVAGALAYLQDRADRLDDAIDAGFLRVQTDTYRLRQMVMDANEAGRVLVSPVLAEIAKADTATLSQSQLSHYLKTFRKPSIPSTSDATTSPRDTGGAAARESADRAGDLPLSGTLFNATITSRRSTGLSGFASTLSDSTLLSAAVSMPREPVFQAKPQIAEANAITLSPAVGRVGGFTPNDISLSQAVVGKPFIRTTRISERLKDPKAVNAHGFALASRHGVVLALSRLARDLAKEDGQDPESQGCLFPQFVQEVKVLGFPDEAFRQLAVDGQLAVFAGPQGGQALASLLSPPIPESDEAEIFSRVTEVGEQTVGLLRQVEGRVQRYRDAIRACQTALELLQDQRRALGLRLGASEERLAEARHDVAVCRALIEEEETRLATINARRRRILAEAVPFVAYRRLRAADERMDVPTRPLDPGLLDAPVPACLESHEDIPEELEGMLALVREAPAAWFGQGLRMVEQLNRIDRLLRTVHTAQWRSRSAGWLETAAPAPAPAATAGAMLALRQRQIATLSRWRQASHQIDTTHLATRSLLEARHQVQDVVSLGDLAEGEHGNAALAQAAAAYLGTISRIAACLHAGLSTAPAALRLAWAETLSAFDQAPSLRNLSALQGFAGLPTTTRHQLQALTDWLFDQLTASEAEAIGLVNDLVRVCLLLASHAPVGRLIAGRLARPVRPRPGGLIPIRPLDGAVLRVGMEATLFRNEKVVARAILEDVGREESQARVIFQERADLELGAEVRVQFSAATPTLAQRLRAF
jgi:hypothetical protein